MGTKFVKRGGVLFLLILLSCAKEKEPSEFCVIRGVVRFENEPHKDAKIEVEICKHTKWVADKSWETKTDKWGRYSIKISEDWFGRHFRIRTILYDKFNQLHVSEWEFGMVKLGEIKKDIWVGGGKPEEEEKKKKRRRRSWRRRRRR